MSPDHPEVAPTRHAIDPPAQSHTEPAEAPAKKKDKYVPERYLIKERLQRWELYKERNQLVALLARLVPGSHLVAANPDNYPEEHKDRKREIVRESVCIHLPDGSNLTWHFSPDSAEFFKGLPYQEQDWDGHTTDEKYRRITEVDSDQLRRSIATFL